MSVNRFRDFKKRARIALPGEIENTAPLELNLVKTVGCESIWKFQEARPHSAPRGNQTIWLRTIVRIDVWYHLTELQLN